MKDSSRVVVIGGGVVGASVLYHLAKIGWTDVLLLEKSELTSGSTWHAAGGMHTFNGEANISRLQKYTIDLYRELEAQSGQSCGLHANGGLMLAATQGELDSLRLICSRARYLGMETSMISLAEAQQLNPLIDPGYFIGALWRADGGHCDPSGTTQAYVKSARLLGASVERFTRVIALRPRPDGSWDVVTDKGSVHAEHVVNCAGLWAREVGRMVGIELPVLAMEHHYLLTEDIPELAGRGAEIVNTTDYAGEIYLRQERGGALIGTYEPNGVIWSPDRTPDDFSMQLLPDDFARLAPQFEVGFRHFPALGRVGIRKAVNGPFTFAPDGNPLVGPVRGLRNYWVACAVMAGFSQGGGIGLMLSRWMAEGDPGQDIISMDVARFGAFATPRYTALKVPENYSRRFRLAYPNEELPRGATAAPLRHLRAPAGRGRRHGREFRARARALVRAAWRGADGNPDLPALRGLRARRQRMPRGARWRGPLRDQQLRQVRSDREGRARLARPRLRLPDPAARTAGSGADAERRRAGSSATCRSPASPRIATSSSVRVLPKSSTCAGSSTARRRRTSPCARPHRRSWAFRSPGPKSRELLQRLVRADLSAAAFKLFHVARDRGRARAGDPGARRIHGRARLRALDHARLFPDALRAAAATPGAASVWCTLAAARCHRCASRKATAPSTRTFVPTTRPARPGSIGTSTGRSRTSSAAPRRWPRRSAGRSAAS